MRKNTQLNITNNLTKMKIDKDFLEFLETYNNNKENMKFKEIKNKEKYFKKEYPFYNPPKMTDERYCLHCGNNIVVGDYKVKVFSDGTEIIVCPNAPTCDGNATDWLDPRYSD